MSEGRGRLREGRGMVEWRMVNGIESSAIGAGNSKRV